MKRIGIYAGTFDPIHNGHVAFAEKALAQGLDKVFFLVEPRPRRKQGVRALEHRLAMANIVASSNPKLGVISLEQARFTPRQTLPPLIARFKGHKLVFLFGDDVIKHMVDNLADWPNVDELANNASLLIAARHHQQDELIFGLKNLEQFGLNFDFEFIEPDAQTINSSSIRQSLKSKKTSLNIPLEVANYAVNNGLYSNYASTTSIK